MITTQDKLIIFDDFIVDGELPKYKKLWKNKNRISKFPNVGASSEDSDEDFIGSSDMSVEFSGLNSPNIFVRQSSNASLVMTNQPSSFFQRVVFWFKKIFGRVEEDSIKRLSVEEFFTSIKNTAEEIVIIKERAIGYEKAMVNAKQSGQRALYEQLEGGLNAQRMETQLVAQGFHKFMKEESLVEFYKKSKKGLRLDWVRNFTRSIPEDIVKKKAKLDAIGVFDNYVVLHYDPKAKSYAETKAEKEARKDPILFGLMKERRILYFVGDWIDDFCDLTLDQIADVLGHEPCEEIK